MLKKPRRILGLILLFFVILFSTPGLFAPAQAAGATLFLSPATGTYFVGDIFNISVMVNSGGGSGINAGEATVNFNKDILMVNSISQAGSIFELWTAKPSFSNNSGTIIFGGGLTTAYKGSAGKIFTISFKAQKTGEAKVTISKALVTEYGPTGKDIFTSAGAGNYTISEKTAPKPADKKPVATTTPTTPTASGILPPAPEITSSSHPNQDQWYSNKKAVLDWKILSSVTGVSFLLTDSPSTTLGSVSDGMVQTHAYDSLADGTYFFHIKLQNKNGWGPTAHRKILVDAEAPTTPKLEIDNGGDATNPNPLLKITATDKTSGISKYKINFNNEDKEVEPRNFIADPYQIGTLAPGRYQIHVTAFDKANNSASSTIFFVVDPLKAPVITDMPKVVRRGEDYSIRGASFYPDATINLFIGRANADPIKIEIPTDDNGDWNYFGNADVEKGNYEIWAKVIDGRGAQSLPSSKQIMSVISPEIIVVYGWYIIIVLIFIIVLLILYIILLKKKYLEEKEQILAETTEAKKKIDEVFIALQEEVDELMVLADKRPGLSESERRIKEKIKEALDISEEFLNKEVEDIEKEVVIPKKKSK